MNGRILIVDGAPAGRIASREGFTHACYLQIEATGGEDALRLARQRKPDLILMSLSLPDMAGADLIRALRNDPVTRRIPILALAGADEDERIAALRGGADDVMPHDAGEVALMARIRNLQRRGETASVVSSAWGVQAGSMMVGMAESASPFEQPGTVGLIATDSAAAEEIRDVLQKYMRNRIRLLTREEALAFGAGHGHVAPEVLMIEAGSEEQGRVLQLMSELSTHPGTRRSIFCVILPQKDEALAATAFDLGAGDVFTSEISHSEMALRLDSLVRRQRESDRLRHTVEDGLRLAMIDPLTSTYNRRYAMPRLTGIAQQAIAENQEFAVMIADLDHFKLVNDAHGHAAGDTVLAEVARRFSDNLRMNDLLARYGGEEFLIVLPQTGHTEAHTIAERLKHVIEDQPFLLPSGRMLSLTVSIGVSIIGPDSETIVDVNRMITEADDALLLSKAAGRNRVTFSQPTA